MTLTIGAYINKREVLHAYSDMKPGTYVIIPATSKSNQAGEFLLRIFSDNSLIDAKAVQLYIPPENTKNGISLWKYNQIEIHIKHFGLLLESLISYVS